MLRRTGFECFAKKKKFLKFIKYNLVCRSVGTTTVGGPIFSTPSSHTPHFGSFFRTCKYQVMTSLSVRDEPFGRDTASASNLEVRALRPGLQWAPAASSLEAHFLVLWISRISTAALFTSQVRRCWRPSAKISQNLNRTRSRITIS